MTIYFIHFMCLKQDYVSGRQNSSALKELQSLPSKKKHILLLFFSQELMFLSKYTNKVGGVLVIQEITLILLVMFLCR